MQSDRLSNSFSSYLLVTTAFAGALAPRAAAQFVDRVSISSAGTEGDGDSYGAPVSNDGRYAVFWSFASNLVPGDTNNLPDVFVHDRVTGTTVRVNVSSSGAEAFGGNSGDPGISTDGRIVCFSSDASNLVPGDTNGSTDVFVHDRDADNDGVFDELGAVSTELVSVSSSGTQSNGNSRAGILSSSGRFVGFESDGDNLVSNDTNQARDVFIRDRQTGTTTRVSVSSNGTEGNLQSQGGWPTPDGRFVSYYSDATNLVAGDTNGLKDVFVRDRDADGNGVFDEPGGIATVCMSRDASGVPSGAIEGGAISADGRYVSFNSAATNLIVGGDTNGSIKDTFVHDRDADVDGIFDVLGATSTVCVSRSSSGIQGNGDSSSGSISADGRYVAFYSWATNFAPGDVNGGRDVFRHDRDVDANGVFDETGWISTECVSLAVGGNPGNLASEGAGISANGQCVGFYGWATDLVTSDTNGYIDVFVWDSACGPAPIMYCTAKVNSNGCAPAVGWSGAPTLGAPDDFYISANNVLNTKFGLFFWSGSGPQSAPFGGGTLCVMPPVIRTLVQNSGGSPPPASDCTGTYSFHFSDDYMSQALLMPGNQVNGQYWSRDPGFAPPNNIGLTNAIQFPICP